MRGCARLFGTARRRRLNPAKRWQGFRSSWRYKPFVFVHLLPVLHQFSQNAVQHPLEVEDAVGALSQLLGDLRVGRRGWRRLLRTLRMLPAPHGLTLCSLVFTTATSFSASTPLPPGAASYLERAGK